MKRLLLSWRTSLLVVAVLLVGMFALTQVSASAHGNRSTIKGLHVVGNRLLNSKNEPIRLRGVNRAGTEYKCVNNAGIFDGPNDAASVDAIASWQANTVRVPLNSACWLGTNGAPAAFSGENYRKAIKDYVALLNSKNLIAILDLHWTAPGDAPAIGQRAMPDADHAYAFWKSVASTFRTNSSVIFDLFNEPYPVDGACWKDGSKAPNTAPCAELDYAVAGLQGLINTIRYRAFAPNVIMVGGWGFANYIGGVLSPSYVLKDPLRNYVISAHVYNFSGCKDVACYDSQYKPVAEKLPLVLGELGENDCQHGFVDQAMDWADQNGVGYLGWAWDTYDCGAFPSLISDYNGTPTEFGVGFKNRFTSTR